LSHQGKELWVQDAWVRYDVDQKARINELAVAHVVEI